MAGSGFPLMTTAGTGGDGGGFFVVERGGGGDGGRVGGDGGSGFSFTVAADFSFLGSSFLDIPRRGSDVGGLLSGLVTGGGGGGSGVSFAVASGLVTRGGK